MKTLRLALTVAMVASVSVLAASPSQAYPALTCTISDVVVEGGEDVTVKATVDPAIESDFRFTYQSEVRTDNGVTSGTATFDTPEVDETTYTTVFATVTQENVTVACTGGTIRLLADDDDDDGDGDGGNGNGGDNGDNGGLLPNTGGERLAWLIIGAVLVVVGGGAIVSSRRRET